MRLTTLSRLLLLVVLAAGCPKPNNNHCEPVEEQCNNLDDDCDNQVDENEGGGLLRRDCSNGCGYGEEECINGGWVNCNAPQPFEELCNGFDDDCNGRIDEDFPCVYGQTQRCGTDEGECDFGVQHCAGNCQWGECQLPYDPADHPEECDGLDNDCDGIIDEDCSCEPGQTRSCGTDEGECTAGLLTCGPDGTWGAECVGEVEPTLDICDGLDNDCDGAVDFTESISFGWPGPGVGGGDEWEVNNECGDGSPLYNSSGRAELVEDGGWVSPSVDDPADLMTYPTLYPPGGDEDWYYTRAVEGGHTCFPWTSQCSFVVDAQLELLDRRFVEGAVQEPEDWRLCVHLGDCATAGDGSAFCTQGTNWHEEYSSYLISVVWGGTCGSNDDRDVKVRVHSPTGAACGHYQLYVQFRYDTEEPCP